MVGVRERGGGGLWGEEEIERILVEVEMGFVAWSVGGGFMAVCLC